MHRDQYSWRYAAVLLLVCMPASRAQAGDVATTLADEVDPADYLYYHQDLLYTWLGCDRGFGPQHDLARDNIVDVLEGFGLPVTLQPFTYQSAEYHNIVAVQTGRDDPGEVYVVGAHFDSVSNPGADDNATGTALVMQVANVLSRHRSPATIHYVLFDREEQGFWGSRAYVAAHSETDIRFCVNTDMVGHDNGNHAVNVYGQEMSRDVVEGLIDAIGRFGNGLGAFPEVRPFAASDHWPFEEVGIPACSSVENAYYNNPYYHTANDAYDVGPDYIDYSMTDGLVRSVVGYLVEEIGITMYADADRDADVDLADIAAFQRCYGGEADGVCAAFGIDDDEMILSSDVAPVLALMTGPSEQ